MKNKEEQLSRAMGCLLAGAAGDALGAPVEFMDRREILRRFGPNGIRDYAPAYGSIGCITDDTQMTLFTAEGILIALAQSIKGEGGVSIETTRQAYLRWLFTQGITGERTVDRAGWLLNQQALFSRRAPGNTCLSALQMIGGEKNNSKGCGGIMRVAPCGILYAGEADLAFKAGAEAAKLTHGHPTGFLAAGTFAAIIADIMNGQPLAQAIRASRTILIGHAEHEETLAALDMACHQAETGVPPQIAISVLGEGWVAEEALAIAVYCALTAANLEDGIINAVNITGDSDSTGTITGNLLGALHGKSVIPQRWLDTLELHAVIENIARDLVQAYQFRHGRNSEDWTCRYLPHG